MLLSGTQGITQTTTWFGLPPKRHPEVTCQVPQAVHVSPSPTPDRPDEGGWTIHDPTEGDTESKVKGIKKEHMDLRGHM